MRDLEPQALASRRTLLPEGPIRPATVGVGPDGAIASVAEGVAPDALDLGDLLLAPALVDIHGDAFERQLMPRPGVMIDVGVALLDTDRQLAANGIGTAFHGLAWSWEPGLRGAGTARAVLAFLAHARAAGRLAVDHRIHVRFETHHLDGVAELEALVAGRRVDLVAFNDHTPAMAADAGVPTGNLGVAYRAMVPKAEFDALARAAHARAAEVPAAVARLAAACRAAGVPTLSHDDATPEARRAYRELGVRICEFPKNLETALAARAAGEPVVMGAPNVLRGRSHLGWLGAAEAVARGACTVLASDYYYPALLQAPYRLAARGPLPLAEAWRPVSADAAAAAGLDDRGALAPGLRADLVAVDDRDPDIPPRAVSLWRGGREVWRSRGR